ncbi:LysR family transcriptional regulator [Photobacterium sanctipauli]|uniref:LysR family transcriptional regulator n=1 Tax=Photobacterium sanctipauli TaxID=1342794 RepID=A0A2T3P0R1_9GAMM|nr:LysR family transcriptional regulator [Photobacterium sanctipauli]PSW22087.1 LysR family transcriptional regulator [Photobacterium sanctipauli]
MNTKQLTTLRAIIATGSASAAALQLGISQSGVSRLLAQLEQELDLALFEREKGRLVIKPENKNLLTHALKTLEQLEHLYEEAEEIKNGYLSKETIKIAVPYTFSSSLIPQLILRLREDYPYLLVELITGSYSFIEECVESGRADIGFTRIYNNPRFSYSPVASGASICVLPKSHPLAEQHTINANHLNNEPLILLGKKSGSRKDIDSFFQRHKITPNIIVEAHSVDVACELVSAEVGISIVNSVLLQGGQYTNIVARPIIDLPRYQYGLITSVTHTFDAFNQAIYSQIGELMREHLTKG